MTTAFQEKTPQVNRWDVKETLLVYTAYQQPGKAPPYPEWKMLWLSKMWQNQSCAKTIELWSYYYFNGNQGFLKRQRLSKSINGKSHINGTSNTYTMESIQWLSNDIKWYTNLLNVLLFIENGSDKFDSTYHYFMWPENSRNWSDSREIKVQWKDNMGFWSAKDKVCISCFRMTLNILHT